MKQNKNGGKEIIQTVILAWLLVRRSKSESRVTQYPYHCALEVVGVSGLHVWIKEREDSGSANPEDGEGCQSLKYAVLEKHNQLFFTGMYKSTHP